MRILLIALITLTGCGPGRAVPTTQTDGGPAVWLDGPTSVRDGRVRPPDAALFEGLCPICNGQCTDVSTDPENCGGCGVRCSPTFVCQNGGCGCPAGHTLCFDGCFDTATDPAHCGGCTVTCAPGSVCHNGQCTKNLLTALQLNGVASLVGGVLRLTEAQGTQNGSAFTKTPIPISSSMTFASYFRFRIHGGSGADGLAFVLQNDPRGSLAIASGSEGGDLAYADLMYYNKTQILNSLAVELDTFPNGPGAPYCDPDDNHVGIGTNGTFTCTTKGAPFDLDSGVAGHVWVDYVGGLLTVYLGATPSKPVAPLLTYKVDLVSLVGTQAHVGFTAATGGATNVHDIETWDFTSTP